MCAFMVVKGKEARQNSNHTEDWYKETEYVTSLALSRVEFADPFSYFVPGSGGESGFFHDPL